MAEHETDDAPTLEIDWVKTAAGALAAVTTAVLLSTLGAVGTLIGAALGSVAATVGSALYAQGLVKSKQAVIRAQETAMQKVGVAQTEVRRAGRRRDEGQDTVAGAHLDAADERLGEARAELDQAIQEPDAAPMSWRERLALLPWKRIALGAAGMFVVVILAITLFEKIAGQSIASYTGGSNQGERTTFGGVTGDSGGGGGKDQPDDTDKPDQTGPSDRPSQDGSGEESGDPSGEPSPGEPSESTTEAPTEAPTTPPTPTATPSPSTSQPATPAPTSPPAEVPTPRAPASPSGR